MKKRRKSGNRLKWPFVALERDLLSSRAYCDLSASAAKLYPHMKMQAGLNQSQGNPDFAFTYRDGQSHGFARATFSRAINELIAKGFVIPTRYGGKRGFCKFENRFALSERWRSYGTNAFEEVPRYDQFKLEVHG